MPGKWPWLMHPLRVSYLHRGFNLSNGFRFSGTHKIVVNGFTKGVLATLRWPFSLSNFCACFYHASHDSGTQRLVIASLMFILIRTTNLWATERKKQMQKRVWANVRGSRKTKKQCLQARNNNYRGYRHTKVCQKNIFKLPLL